MKNLFFVIIVFLLLGVFSQHLFATYPAYNNLSYKKTENISFALQPCPSLLNYAVTFHVTGLGNDLEGAWVTVGPVTLQTNSSGIVEFSLADGDYTYTVTKEGFADEEGTFTVAGEPQLIEVWLQVCYDVTFHVVGCDSAVININGQVIYPNSNGNASICLANGFYSYSVSCPGYIPTGGQVVVNGSPVSLIIVLNPILYGVTFFVNCCGEPLEGIMLTIGTTTLITGANGLAIFNLAEGDYTVEINGYIFNFSVPETSYVDADICSEVLFSVSSGGEPVEEASITINNESVVTNTLGIAEYCASPGLYQYSIEKVGYLPKSGSVTVTTEPAIIEEHLECEVTFTVWCYGMLEGATIGCGMNTVVTGPDGSATMSLEDGAYEYYVTHPDMGTMYGNIFVNGFPLLENFICTEISELSQKMLKFYPNPSSGKFSIENLNQTGEPTEILVTDITGRVVYQTITANSDKAEIDLTDQQKGMYFVRVKSGEMMVNRKVVIQ